MEHQAPTLTPDTYKAILDQVGDGVYVLDEDDRIVYWNAAREALTGYTAQETLGHRCSDELLKHVDSTGRQVCFDGCPMKAARVDGQPRQTEVFLHHKQGHRVPVRVHVRPLRDTSGNPVAAVQSFVDITDKLAVLEQVKQLEDLAYLDPLTGLANRRFLEQTLEARLGEADRYGWTLGVIMMDIDHFKAVNDTYGHEAGDRVLQMVARTLRGVTRSYDLVGRWGGEEFMALLTNTSSDDLLAIAERYRALVEQSDVVVDGKRLQVTISLGAALAEDSFDTVHLLVARADESLYRSKHAGRNRVTLYDSAPQLRATLTS